MRLAVKQNDELVGYVHLHGDESGRRELGFVIGRRALWRRGIGTQAARARLLYGFPVMRLEEVWAEALEAALASTAILRRVGMTQTRLGEEGDYAGTPSRYRQFSIAAEQFGRRDAPLGIDATRSRTR